MSHPSLRGLAAFALLTGGGLSAQCLDSFTYTADPLPQDGVYCCGASVDFCFRVTGWSMITGNWFHGLVPSFGPGWDTTSLVPGTPPAAFGPEGGTWAWYESVTSSTGFTAGPGFFFDLDGDGDPGNSFGDFGKDSIDLQFCWTIHVLEVPDCVPGLDLGVSVDCFGDGETGSWESEACRGDTIALSAPALTASCTVGFHAPSAQVVLPVPFPTVFTDRFTVDLGGTSAGNSLLMIDAMGRVVLRLSNLPAARVRVERGTLPAGAYHMLLLPADGARPASLGTVIAQ